MRESAVSQDPDRDIRTCFGVEDRATFSLGLCQTRSWVATFRRKIDVLGRVIEGALQRKTRRGDRRGLLQNLMERAGGFTGQPAFPLRGRC